VRLKLYSLVEVPSNTDRWHYQHSDWKTAQAGKCKKLKWRGCVSFYNCS